jgi:hypothetical protein
LQKIRIALLVVGSIVVVASLFTTPRSSGAADGLILSGAEVPSHVMEILQRSCVDCHSERTRYPWYSYVAPVSLLIRRDVEVGRKALNFSRWSELTPILRQRRLSGIANQVRDGEMPLGFYTWLHPEAALSEVEKDAIFQWTQGERVRLIREAAAAKGTN